MAAPRILRLVAATGLSALLPAPAPAPGAVAIGVDQKGLAVLDLPEGGGGYISGAVVCFGRAAGGSLFVGSNHLSEYDGSIWRRCEVPGAMRFLSLAADAPGGRMWVAADGALGYLERDRMGDWKFRSLGAEAEAAGANLSEVRFVQAVPGGAVFILRSSVMRWNGRTFSTWSLPAPIRLYPYLDGDRLYIYQPGVGLLRMEAAGPRLWMAGETLPSPATMAGFFSLPGGDGVAVFSNEAWGLRAGRWVRLGEATAAIRGKLAFCTVRLENGNIAIGTLYGGVVLIRPDGAVVRRVNAQGGLADECANVVFPDGAGGLWIGTATGIARLRDPERASLYDQRTGLASGAVRRVFWLDGRLMAMTSHRVYVLRADPPAVIEPAEPANIGAYWATVRDVVAGGDGLWAGGVGGLWQITATSVRRDSAWPGDITRFVTPRFPPRGTLAFGAGGALIRREGGSAWTRLPVDPPPAAAPLSAVEDDRGRIWTSGPDGKVSEFAWQGPKDRLDRVGAYFPGHGLPAEAAHPVVFALDGSVLAFTESGVLAFDPLVPGFVPAPGLGDYRVVVASSPAGRSAYWAVQFRKFGQGGPRAVMRVERAPGGSGRFQLVPIVTPGLDRLGEVASLSLTEEAGRRELWVGGVNSLLRISLPDAEAATPPPALEMRRVSLGGRGLVARGEAAPAEVPPGSGRLVFEFAPGGRATNDSGFLFETRLEGVEREWSAAEPSGRREFTGLAPGGYAFLARAIDRFGRPGPPLRYAFAVGFPWYRTLPMMAGWIGLAAVLLLGGVRLRERRLTRQAGRLNRLVDERTRELSLSNTAKSEFLENISHEIHDPLYGIVGLVDLIGSEGLSAPQREYARSLKECSRSLIRLFDDVLNFSMVEYGFASLNERDFLAAELVGSVRDLFLGAAAERGSVITVRMADGFHDGFHGDGPKIKAILGNFVGNAVKYAPGTPIEIAVSAMETEGPGHSILFEVSDGGPGIPAEEQELVFKKFVRGSRARESGIHGTGIGLATCRGLARLLGGSVGLECPAGRGAVFYLKVPLAPAAPGGTPAAAGNEPEAGWALVVEDQPFNQVILTGLLGRLGYRTETAGDAAGALAAAGRRHFGVIFIDLELPQVGGMELARKLRQTPAGPGLLLVGTSANDAGEEALASGMNAFLAKPLTEEKIRSVPGLRPPQAESAGPGMEGPDHSALELYARGRPGGMAEAGRAYGEALAGEVGRLREAVRLGDAEAIARAAHRVQSHAMIAGAARLGAAARALEAEARRGLAGVTPGALESVLREAGELGRAFSPTGDRSDRARG